MELRKFLSPLEEDGADTDFEYYMELTSGLPKTRDYKETEDP